MNYHFEDFTEKNYVQLLEKAKSQYSFCFYNNYDQFENSIVWRHDIDISPHRAKSLSEIERSLTIKAIYFIQLDSEFYNIFESEITEIINNIIQNEHEIGLHFNAAKYNIKNLADFEYWLRFESDILKKLFKKNIMFFSYHNPTADILKFSNFNYCGLINAYSKKISEDFKYCSDSNGYWRFDRLESVLDKSQHPKLHILTHPVWWQKRILSPYDRVLRSIDGRAQNNREKYEMVLKGINRENIK